MVKRKSNLADAVHGAARADKRPRETRHRTLTRNRRKACCSDSRQHYTGNCDSSPSTRTPPFKRLGVEALERILEERQR